MSDKKSFLTAAITGLSNLTRLEVNTMIGDYNFNQDRNGTNTTIKNDNTGERMCSQINLITGAMTVKFVSDYKDLRKYHLAREVQGHEIILKNIEVLQKILETVTQFEEKIAKTTV